MAINLIGQYPGKVGAIVAGVWPYGEPRNITVPGDGTGTPWEAALVKDIIGLQHALLTSGNIAPSATPETAAVSQYLQAIVEIASGRAYNYDESGIADAYVLDTRTGQQGPASYYDGMEIRFTPGNTNTGASTVDVNGLGARALTMDGTIPLFAGILTATVQAPVFVYNGTNFELKDPLSIFRGATVNMLTPGTAVVAGADVIWEVAQLDTDGATDIGGANPERLTVPAWATRAKVSFAASSVISTGPLWSIYKNNALLQPGGAEVATMNGALDYGGISSAWLPVVGGDYFTVRLVSGTGVSILGAESWMDIQFSR